MSKRLQLRLDMVHSFITNEALVTESWQYNHRIWYEGNIIT